MNEFVKIFQDNVSLIKLCPLKNIKNEWCINKKKNERALYCDINKKDAISIKFI